MTGGGGHAGARAPVEEHPNLTLVDHPLVHHKVTILRSEETQRKLFRELVDEISMLMAYEATAHLDLAERPVHTPLEETRGWAIDQDALVLVPVLRAGLGMVEGMRRIIPTMNVGHIGLQRSHDTLEPVDYYFNIPPEPRDRQFIVVDPMLATGGTAVAAIRFLQESGVEHIRFVCIVAAPEGVSRMEEEHPDVPILAAALDRELDEHGYIRPGLGDAGDRLYGT